MAGVEPPQERAVTGDADDGHAVELLRGAGEGHLRRLGTNMASETCDGRGRDALVDQLVDERGASS